MESIKCNLCRKTKPSYNFLKNGKTLKSCVACRDKNKTVKDPVALPVVLPKKPEPKEPEPKEPEPKEPEPKEPEPKESEPKEPEPIELINVVIPMVHSIHVPKGWKFLSGKWIKIHTELELHQELTKKMILQFKKRSARPVHQYLMKRVFVDIRDLYIS